MTPMKNLRIYLMILSRAGKTVSMHFVLFVMMTLLNFSVIAAAPVETELLAEQWELSRSGERLLKIDGLADVVEAWSRDTGQHIELQYPGGEEGELWVYQLMDWLVALGIPSASLVAVPGSGEEDLIRLRVIRSGGDFR
jgi:hypothetical protein